MRAPVDYPLIDHAHSAQFTVDELTYAALLDRTDTLVPAGVEATALTADNSDLEAAHDPQLSKPGTGVVDGMISRWSRALR